MREMFFATDAAKRGLSRSGLRTGQVRGDFVDAGYGVFAMGSTPLTLLERSAARAKATGGCVSGSPAGEFYEFDSVVATRVDFTVSPTSSNCRPGARRRVVQAVSVDGICVVTATQALLDLAATLDDDTWEQALESALRKRLTTIAEIEAALPAMSAARTPGVRRIRRVLALRPLGAPPTESLLETLAVQLFREAGLPSPTRQLEIRVEDGRLVARVDLAWPELGVFVELDGQGHLGQPVYDASWQTAVIAATGWLCARFTWRQVVRHPEATVREMRAVLAQAARLHRAS